MSVTQTKYRQYYSNEVLLDTDLNLIGQVLTPEQLKDHIVQDVMRDSAYEKAGHSYVNTAGCLKQYINVEQVNNEDNIVRLMLDLKRSEIKLCGVDIIPDLRDFLPHLFEEAKKVHTKSFFYMLRLPDTFLEDLCGNKFVVLSATLWTAPQNMEQKDLFKVDLSLTKEENESLLKEEIEDHKALVQKTQEVAKSVLEMKEKLKPTLIEREILDLYEYYDKNVDSLLLNHVVGSIPLKSLFKGMSYEKETIIAAVSRYDPNYRKCSFEELIYINEKKVFDDLLSRINANRLRNLEGESIFLKTDAQSVIFRGLNKILERLHVVSPLTPAFSTTITPQVSDANGPNHSLDHLGLVQNEIT